MRFVDTSILLYSISSDPVEAAKAAIAMTILTCDDLGLSVQVLQEFYAQATRPTKPGALSPQDAVAFVSTWLRFPVESMTVPIMQAAFATKARWQISYWDAAIIEAARAGGCQEVLSEDLSHQHDYGGVWVTNPFL